MTPTILRPIPPRRPAELPRRTKAFWRLTGPGAVLVGLSIGAGELVIWPHIAAEHGSSMLWAAALGVFLQLWVNIEIGRYTVATGESAYTGLSRLWVLLGPLFILGFGLVTVVMFLRRRAITGIGAKAGAQGGGAKTGETAPQTPEPLSEDEKRRLKALMKDGGP